MTRTMTAKLLTTVLVAVMTSTSSADILYNNGSAISHPGAHASGQDVSLMQSLTLGDGTFGFGTGRTNNGAQHLRLMDDFFIPVGQTWRLTGAQVFGYQTASGLTGMSAGTLRIWSGNPMSGGTLVYGDTSTNVLESQSLAGYRISERGGTGTNFADTLRPIWDVLLGMDIELGAGQYWLDWSLTGGANPNGSVFTPPVTIPGQGVTLSGGQPLQYNALTNVFTTNLRHSGSNNAIDLPFILQGTAIPELSAASLAGVTTVLAISILIGRRTRVDVPHPTCSRPKHASVSPKTRVRISSVNS